MREISLDRLRTLVEIVDRASFAEASRRLNLAPPTVSLHITELENRIGAPLLSRKRGQIRPTSIGESLVEHARRLLGETERALEDVQRQALGLAGRVRLGASTGAIAHLLPQALATLGRQHPDIDVQVAILTSQETLLRLANGALDIGLVALPQTGAGDLSIHPWRRDPVMAFVPAEWNSPATLSPDWLAVRPLILNDASTRLQRLTAEWFANAGLHPKARIELNYNDAIRSLVAAGYGAALLPYEDGAAPSDARLALRALTPPLWRDLGIAHRKGEIEPATQHVLNALWQLRQT